MRYDQIIFLLLGVLGAIIGVSVHYLPSLLLDKNNRIEVDKAHEHDQRLNIVSQGYRYLRNVIVLLIVFRVTWLLNYLDLPQHWLGGLFMYLTGVVSGALRGIFEIATQHSPPYRRYRRWFKITSYYLLGERVQVVGMLRIGWAVVLLAISWFIFSV